VSDTRDLDGDDFAEHMRARRGAPPPDSRFILHRNFRDGIHGPHCWYATVTVSDKHPWYGHDLDECTDGGQLDLSLLLDDSEEGEATLEPEVDGWCIVVWCHSYERAEQLMKFLCDAAEACVSVRLSGTVVSSR
jgi:hypothetical protein